MGRGSVRARTTAAAVAVMLPMLGVAGTAGVLVQRHDLTDGVAALAEEQARRVAAEPRPDAAGSEEVVVQVLPLDGSGDGLVPVPAGDTVVRSTVTGVVPGEPDRFLAVALRADDGTSYVVVARSLESVDSATASTTGLFVAGGLLVLVAVGTLTWLVTGRALSPVEQMRRRADSISADDLSSRLPVPASDDEVARLATTMNDLLDRLEASTRTQRRFVADASHELRSPVATIRALVESDLLSSHPGGRDALAGEVLDEAERLGAIVDDLLVLARGDARLPVEHAPVDLSALVRAEAARHRRTLVRAVVQDDLVLSGDAAGLARALRNLLDNAERFAATGISVVASGSSELVHVEVADDGPGVPEPERERVFDRFVRLDAGRTRADGGTGLGLAIVRQVARDHGGHVRVEPVLPDGVPPGARFVLTVPIV